MTVPFGPGPVFRVEVQAMGRRRSGYVARVAFVAVLLLIPGLGLYFVPRMAAQMNRGEAVLLFGRSAFRILVMVQVTVVLLAAPAAAADAFGRDRPRGPLGHLLVTDLSALDIVVGTVAARFVPVVMLLMAAVPVAILEVVVFGTDAGSMLTLAVVSLGLAMQGVSLAAALSLWSRRSYEALLGAYSLLLGWLLLPSVLSSFGMLPPPNWLLGNQPYAFSVVWNIFWIGGSGTRSLPSVDALASLVHSVVLSMVILALIAARLRALALREPRPRRDPKLPVSPGVFGLLRNVSRRSLKWLPGPSLDGNPVLWREWWHSRQSRYSQVFWLIYASALTIFTAWAFVDFMGGRRSRPLLIPCAAFGTGFGLLAVAVRSASAWTGERAGGRGGLDVLLSTPLSASEIVRGKWWACYRPVIGVAIVPTFVAMILAIGAPTLPEELSVIPPPVTPLPLRMIDRVAVAGVVMGQGLLYGAAVVSLGLWLATRFSRPGRAVMLTVVVYGTIGLVWPMFEEMFLMRRIDRNLSEGLAAVSPLAAATVTLMPMFSPWYGTARQVVPYAAGWLVVAAAVAIGGRWWTIRNMDRWIGRIDADSRPDASDRRVAIATCVVDSSGRIEKVASEFEPGIR